jgi:hypothetical protein
VIAHGNVNGWGKGSLKRNTEGKKVRQYRKKQKQK